MGLTGLVAFLVLVMSVVLAMWGHKIEERLPTKKPWLSWLAPMGALLFVLLCWVSVAMVSSNLVDAFREVGGDDIPPEEKSRQLSLGIGHSMRFVLLPLAALFLHVASFVLNLRYERRLGAKEPEDAGENVADAPEPLSLESPVSESPETK